METNLSAQGRRKILFYVPSLDRGGAEKVVATLAAGLADRGHAVCVASDVPGGSEARLLPRHVRREILGTHHGRAVLRLARLCRGARPDIVVSALTAANLKAFAATLLARQPRRLVQTFHGFPDAEPQHLTRLGYLALPLSSRVSGATIAVSDALRAALVARFHAAPARTLHLPNPLIGGGHAVEPTRIPPDGPPLVLALGRLEPVKDFSGLLRAFAHLPAGSARLAILGEGSERPALERLVDGLGLAGHVALPGHVANVDEFYAGAACVVVSSRSEAFALTLVEALSHGLPVVAVDSPGPREILAGGRFGTLVAPGDPPALAAALRQVLAEPGDGAARRGRAAEFALGPILDRWEALVEALASHRAVAGL